MIKIGLSVVLMLFALSQNECDDPSAKHAQVAVASKNGDSCLADHKCKIVIRRWENGQGDPKLGGNVYYQCWVSDAFYSTVGLEDRVIVDLTSDKCERANP